MRNTKLLVAAAAALTLSSAGLAASPALAQSAQHKLEKDAEIADPAKATAVSGEDAAKDAASKAKHNASTAKKAAAKAHAKADTAAKKANATAKDSAAQ